MASHPYTLLSLLLGVLLAATLACQGAAAVKTTAAKQSKISGPTLQLKDGELTCLKDGEALKMAAKSSLPYRIAVSSNTYSLVTTCGSELKVVTYSTDGANVRKFADMLPLTVQPPVAALAGLADTEAGGATGVVLLGSRGEQVWRDPLADLLWPTVGSPRADAYCVSQGSDSNPLGIYGLQPALVRVTCPAGSEIWRKPIAAKEYVEDVILHGLGSKYGLLCLQYGTELYEFFIFDIASGTTKSVKRLDGAPAFRSWYPGPIPGPVGVEQSGDNLSVTVLELDGGWTRLTFNLATGTVKHAAAKPLPTLGERNPHPDGGDGSAKPPLFPQGILPTQAGSSWTIPALVNAKGQVFVVTADGASWVTP